MDDDINTSKYCLLQKQWLLTTNDLYSKASFLGNHGICTSSICLHKKKKLFSSKQSSTSFVVAFFLFLKRPIGKPSVSETMNVVLQTNSGHSWPELLDLLITGTRQTLCYHASLIHDNTLVLQEMLQFTVE